MDLFPKIDEKIPEIYKICHDQNGELYNVTLSRDRVTLQSYSDDAIRTKVET